jgi:hypothetical protein
VVRCQAVSKGGPVVRGGSRPAKRVDAGGEDERHGGWAWGGRGMGW